MQISSGSTAHSSYFSGLPNENDPATGRERAYENSADPQQRPRLANSFPWADRRAVIAPGLVSGGGWRLAHDAVWGLQECYANGLEAGPAATESGPTTPVGAATALVGLGEPTLALVEVGVTDVVGTALLFSRLPAQLITEQSAADTAEGTAG